MTRWRCSLSGEWNIEKTRGIIRGMTRKGRGIVRKKAEAPSGILRKSSGVLRGLSPSRAAKRLAATSWNWPVTRDYCRKFAPRRRCEQLDGNKGISNEPRRQTTRSREIDQTGQFPNQRTDHRCVLESGSAPKTFRLARAGLRPPSSK